MRGSVGVHGYVCRYCGSDYFTLIQPKNTSVGQDKDAGHPPAYIYHYGDYNKGCGQRISLDRISEYVVMKDIYG